MFFGINDLNYPIFLSVMDLLCPHLFRECPRETVGPQLSLWFSLHILPSIQSGLEQVWNKTSITLLLGVARPPSNCLRILQPASLPSVAKPRGIQCPQPPCASFIQAPITITYCLKNLCSQGQVHIAEFGV